MGIFLFIPFSGAHAATIVGGDFGGANLIPNDLDILSGTFTNVGTFSVLPGRTVFVEVGTALSVTANSIVIEGQLNADGAGFAGGLNAPTPTGTGFPGAGTGGGEGGQFGSDVHGSGGGGGGYGGAGGNSGQSLSFPPAALGGISYGTANPPGVQMGSGGGGAANHNFNGFGTGGAGGNGGGAVSLFAGTIILQGSITANGVDGQQGVPATFSVPGGGGGSGGGIELSGDVDLDGTLSAAGGDGADFIGPAGGWYGQGGGGGAGGRIKLSGVLVSFGPSFTVDSAGGAGGLSDTITLTPSTAGGGGSSVNLLGPFVQSITRADADPTEALSVVFTVTFSEFVDGVDMGDFAIDAVGVTGASVTGVLGGGGSVTYTVTVDTGTGDGTLSIDLNDDDSITSNFTDNPLGGFGVGNGDFTAGEAYTIGVALPAASWWALLATMVSLLMAAAIVWRWRRMSASTK